MLPALYTFHSASRCVFSPIRSLSLILKNFRDETDSEFYANKKANNNNDGCGAQMGKQSLRTSRSKLLKEKMPYLSYQTCRYFRDRSKTYSIQFSCKKLLLMRKTSFLKYSLSMRDLKTETQVRSYTTKSVSETLIDWENKLKAASVPEPRLSAEHIIAHILGVPRVSGTDLLHVLFFTTCLILFSSYYNVVILRKIVMSFHLKFSYEDMRALDGGKEGLDMIKPILLQFQHLLSAGKYLILEVDPCHQYLVPAWMAKQKDMKLKLLEVIKDFQGKERFLKFVKSN
ncbi:uncharacterized protein LOC135222460 [Macrobrachium nipponense]|uniref:uncharacterized protein LOC135222460 n=1 Tax=Macrobrachium nipponense TaxID=159736 RepID=UPI0030C824B6